MTSHFMPAPRRSYRRKERDKRSKNKFEFGLCVISGQDCSGSGFLVEKGISRVNYLITSKEVISTDDVGDRKSMRKYLLKFRESVKSPVELAEVPLHEISKLSTSQEPAGDNPEIIFIRLRSKSKKFREQLKGRPFSYVEQDLQNADNLYFTFVEISEDNFVKRLSINQDGSEKYTVDEDGSPYTTYESLIINLARRPLGGAILKKS